MQVIINTVANDAEHDLALTRIKVLWRSESDSDRAELDILTLLVDRYEQARWPIGDDLDPVDMIKGAIEHGGRTRDDLATLLGSPSCVSEILARQRPLTLDMIRTVSEAWGIPVRLLTPAYALEPTSVSA